jgi:PAT family beta-lactamase induction signal transducer AmpG
MIAVAVTNALVMPHPAEHHPQEDAAVVGGKPPARAAFVAFLAAYRSFLSQPQATRVFAFMLLYRLGDIMMFAMSSPMLQDIGIGPGPRSILRSFQIVGFMAGSIVGGFVIARRGLGRCLVPMSLIQNLMIPLYIGLAVWKPHFAGVAAIVTIEQIASGIGTSANSVFIMQRCRTTFAASHFAFATSLVSLTSTVSGFLSGPINERVGHPWFFTIAFLASLPGLVLAFVVPKDPLEPATPAPADAEASGTETG